MKRALRALLTTGALVLLGCQSETQEELVVENAPVVDSSTKAAADREPSAGPAASASSVAPTQSAPVLVTPTVQADAPIQTPNEIDLLTDPRRDPWLGDFDGMVERRAIRALVTYSRTHYFLDGAQPRGLGYEALKRFEEVINEQLGTGQLKVHVVAIPVTRDELFPALLAGRGDVALAHLMITEDRAAIVDFSLPFFDGVSELVVTSAGGPPLSSVEGLSGREVHVRTSSTYYTSLLTLNERLVAAGSAPVRIVAVDERLEDEDLLEMLDAGLVPAVVTDSFRAEFWSQIFTNLRVNPQLALRTDGRIAWAFRKSSPEFKAVVDDFAREHRRGTLLGNMGLQYYLKDASYVRNALAAEDLARFRSVAGHFRSYADRYGLDWRLLIAQGYQESRLDHDVESPAGAVGVMQLLPATAADDNVDIPQIDDLESNIHAGAKYMRFLLDRYFADESIDPLNRYLLAFAAYNAGPRRVAELRREAAEQGLDPNLWFDNVERIAARRIGRETVQYVSNIFKYYVTYRRFTDLGRLETPAPRD